MDITIKNSQLTATIKSLGAELCSLKDKSEREYIWEGDPKFWGKHSPILFPIVGTLANDCYTLDNKIYHMFRHGFAREMMFDIKEQKEDQVVFSLQSSEETFKLYPFEFELLVSYTLNNNSLSVEYKIINNSKVDLPFSIGAHPAFALPSAFESYSVKFEKQELLKYFLLQDNLISDETENLELENKELSLNYDLFKNDALVFKTMQSKSLTILQNEVPFLKVHFKDFPSLGLWTKLDAPFLCIEPWFGYSDTKECNGNLYEKEGIIVLKNDAVFHSQFTIEILK